MIITRTPFRVSFFGGGTDYPDWFRANGGAVLATSIDKYCYLSVRNFPPFFENKHRVVWSKVENPNSVDEIEHPAVRAIMKEMRIESGVAVHHDGDLPARSGLGSSSAFSVGLINAFHALQGHMASKMQLAREAIRIEQKVLRENVGCQDQITTAFGGFNRIDFLRDGRYDITPIILPPDRLLTLQSSLMLFFTGVSRYSSEVAKEQIGNLGKRETELRALHAGVDQAIDALTTSRELIRDFGALLNEAWSLKRSLAHSISTPFIDQIYESAREAGAIGGKLLGAGGGGFLLFVVPPERRTRVREKLKSLIHVGFRFETGGSKVVVYEPNGLET